MKRKKQSKNKQEFIEEVCQEIKLALGGLGCLLFRDKILDMIKY